MNSYSLTVSNITDTSVSITLTHDSGSDPVDEEVVIIKQGATEIARQTANMPTGAAGDTDTLEFTSLIASTTYTAELSSGDGSASPVSFTTKATGYNDPKMATQEQWEDLADKIQAKANSADVPVITMTTVDPGEGASLAENHFIAVYSAS